MENFGQHLANKVEEIPQFLTIFHNFNYLCNCSIKYRDYFGVAGQPAVKRIQRTGKGEPQEWWPIMAKLI